MSTGVGAVGLFADVPAASRKSHVPRPAEGPAAARPAERLSTPPDQAFQVATINERLTTLAKQAGFDRGKVDFTV